jgi:TonB family protein
MQQRPNVSPGQPANVPTREFRLLIEPEPWLKVFLHNVGDLFRREPPKVWMTSGPGEYWPDALVHRPVAWKRLLQSCVAHAAVVACVYAGNLYWLNQPHVISEEPPKNAAMLNYQLSEYVPEVKPQATHEIPVRERAQKGDPAPAPQRIVTLNVDHASTQQTVIQADPRLLQHDVPMPNVVAWTAVPVAPLATHHPLRDLTQSPPEVATPSQQSLERNVSRLTFPAMPQPQVVAPSSPITTNSAPQIPAIAGPAVIPPASEVARRNPSALILQAQAPQVAGPTSVAVARSNFAVLTPAEQPEVVPPAQATVQHSLNALQLSGSGPGQRPAVAPPSAPAAGGLGRPQAQEAGQLLVLNAHPLAPDVPVTLPEGSRKGEFAAGPEGKPGASGSPETRKGKIATADHPGAGSGPATVSVEPPPDGTAGNRVASSTARSVPMPHPSVAVDTVPTDVPGDRIDNLVFGSRRRYSMHLNMPNLNSRMGSWTVRFAELNGDPAQRGDLTAPEAIRKVDPAYPANLMRDQIEGVVVLHAVIHSDGSVGEVRVLEGFYEQLDENARAALEQWRFVPGTKNGVPVDVEAVIRVPFRVSKLGF